MSRIRYLGHATVLIDLGETRILTDPILTGRVMFIRRVAGAQPVPPRPPAAVLVSHGHHDHLHRASMAQLSRGVPLIVPAGLGRLVRGWGSEHVIELRAGDEIDVDGVHITAVPAVHSNLRPPSGPRAEPLGFLISGAGTTVYFAGDTDLFDEMSDLARVGIDVALLPVWGWGPRLGPGHLDPERAADAVARLRPTTVIPIHWGTLWPIAMRWHRHRLTEPPLQLVEAVARRDLPARVVVLPPGDALELPAALGAA